MILAMLACASLPIGVAVGRAPLTFNPGSPGCRSTALGADLVNLLSAEHISALAALAGHLKRLRLWRYSAKQGCTVDAAVADALIKALPTLAELHIVQPMAVVLAGILMQLVVGMSAMFNLDLAVGLSSASDATLAALAADAQIKAGRRKVKLTMRLGACAEGVSVVPGGAAAVHEVLAQGSWSLPNLIVKQL